VFKIKKGEKLRIIELVDCLNRAQSPFRFFARRISVFDDALETQSTNSVRPCAEVAEAPMNGWIPSLFSFFK
jgi:hypothetical protein